MLCENCKATLPSLARRINSVNSELWKLGLEYHPTLGYSIDAASRILAKYDFREIDQSVSITGRLHVEVGEGKWLSMSWYRLDSGNWEVVAYVN